MNSDDVRSMLAAGEGQHVEFKETLGTRTELAKDLVCFANADGGTILVGVRDEQDGRFTAVGVHDTDGLSLAVDDAAYQHCQPPISVVIETATIDDKRLLVLRIPRGDARPYRTGQGTFYLRSGSRCRHASQSELRSLFQAAGSLTFDESTLTRTAVATDLDMARFEAFQRDHAGPGGEGVDPPVLLRNWRLATPDGQLTVAGLLLFGREPQRFLPHAYVSAARVAGTDAAGTPLDTLRADGTLQDQLEDVERFLRVHLRSPREIRDFEDERREELPLTAMRELIVNAIAHRDYVVTGPVRLLIYDDRVEIRSPGPPPNSVDAAAMLSGVHVMRNPHLYSRLAMAGLVTDTGSGVARARRQIQDATGEDLSIRITDQETVVTVPRP